ncbi:MAG: aldo/keto reductase [Candidatus Micrarchaeota archaeon]|nr:aldo/keto reductase [Candidatus Micrarchaeota archaeon]MDE1849983.1 aldo/keto reductase [Candidatus Micrarchaeota archaeon]
MRKKELGKTGEQIPELGMGTWKLGQNVELEILAMKEGFKNGMRFVDTAEMYHTEDIVGRAISGESGIFVATKVSPNHFAYDDVIKSCDSSLRNLGIRTIDLYQLHWPNPRVQIKDTMKAMEKLVEDGKIRHIGVSNFSVDEMKAAQDALKRNEIVSNQVEYSVLVRDVEDGLLDFCQREKVTVIAYSPLAMGKLFDERHAKLNRLLRETGRGYGKTVSQVALNWLLCKDGVVAIPKAASVEHAVENAGSSDFRLSEKDIERIDHFL